MSFAEQASRIAAGLPWCGGELVLIVVAVGVLLADAFLGSRHRRVLNYLSLGGLLVAAWMVGQDLQELRASGAPRVLLLEGRLCIDPFSCFFRLVILLGSLVSLALAQLDEASWPVRPGVVQALVLLATLGAMVLASASDLLLVFLGIELLSVCGALLVGLHDRRRTATEAALKLAFLSMMAGALTLLGLAFLYGLVGSTSLSQMAAVLAGDGAGAPPPLADAPSQLTLMIIALLVFAALAAKAMAFPVHFWVPDVMQGGRLPVAAFLCTVPVAGALGILIRMLHPLAVAEAARGSGLPAALSTPELGLAPPWGELLQVAGAISMLLGNLAALHQESVRRMLGYGCITHAGFMLVGVAMMPAAGAISCVALYLVTYLPALCGALAVVLVVERSAGSDRLTALAGLHRRAPALTWLLVLFLLGLVGLPPTAGFVARWELLRATLDRQVYWLAIWTLLNVVLALAHHGRILRALFASETDHRNPVVAAPLAWAISLAMALPTLLLLGVLEPLARCTLELAPLHTLPG